MEQTQQIGSSYIYGLRDVTLGPPTHTSSVDPEKGVSYAAIPILELLDRQPEEVIHLLMTGALPDGSQLEVLKRQLAEHGAIPPEYLRRMTSICAEGKEPMVLLQQMVLELSAYWGADLKAERIRVIAAMPHLVATAICHRLGRPAPASRPEMGLLENFRQMLPYEWEASASEVLQQLSLHYLLHFDHDGGNLSTHTAKTVTSGRPRSAAQVVEAGINALNTDLHGAACLNAYQFLCGLKEIEAEQLSRYIQGYLAEGHRLPGYGHAVLIQTDPRAKALSDSLRVSPDQLVQKALQLERLAPQLIETAKGTARYPNVDAFSGLFLARLGVPQEDFMLFFALSRTVGWMIQAADYQADSGQLMRPHYAYEGR